MQVQLVAQVNYFVEVLKQTPGTLQDLKQFKESTYESLFRYVCSSFIVKFEFFKIFQKEEEQTIFFTAVMKLLY